MLRANALGQDLGNMMTGEQTSQPEALTSGLSTLIDNIDFRSEMVVSSENHSKVRAAAQASKGETLLISQPKSDRQYRNRLE